jgi:tetratricopeptide (TPR) repeat protein
LQQSLQSLLKSSSSVVTETLDALNNLAIVKSNLGDHSGEEQAYRQALELGTKALGEDHPQIAITTLNLAIALQGKGDLENAGPLFDRSLALCRRVLGAQHPYTIIALASYGTYLYRKGDLRNAAAIMRETLDLDQQTGASQSRTGYHQTTLGLIQHDQEAYADAEASLRAALNNFAKALPPTHPYVANARRALGLTLVAQHRDREAEQELRVALQSAESGGNQTQLAAIRATLGRAIAGQRRFAEAEPLLLESFRVLLPALGADHPLVKRTRAWIEELYLEWHKPGEASAFFASQPAPNTLAEK